MYSFKSKFTLISILFFLIQCSTINVALTKNKQAVLGARKMAVMPFEVKSPAGNQGQYFSNIFAMSIVKLTSIDVIERVEMEKLLKEQKLARTGLIDESTAAEMGKILGVDAIVIGSGEQLQIEIEKPGAEKDTVVKETKLIENGLSKFFIKIVNVQNGIVLFTASKDPGIEWTPYITAKYVLGLGLIWSKNDMMVESCSMENLSKKVISEMESEIRKVKEAK